MALSSSIDKFPDYKSPASNYEFLRTRGIAYIQQLAAEKWTDHNIHDPGITMLEMICYAMTDLAYKTDYAIEDILAEKSLLDEKNKSSKIALQSEREDTFFSAREILPNNPLTLTDWRKFIIDIPLVRNAWLMILQQSTPVIYRDEKLSLLTYTPNNRTKRLNIDGLYDIHVEFEKDDLLGDLNIWEYAFNLSTDDSSEIRLYFKPKWDVFFENNLDLSSFNHAYLGPFNSVEDTAIYTGSFHLKSNDLLVSFDVNIESPLAKTDANKAIIDNELLPVIDDIALFLKQRIALCTLTANRINSRIHQHRNLCEDFVCIKHSEVEEVAVCTDIEVKPDADIEKILARMYLVLENFFSPSMPFYSLEEMLEKGLTPDRIFNGPVLQHGFIRDEDLELADYREVVHVSDVIRLLMDIDGLVAIRNLQLSKYFCGLVLNDGEEWCLPVTQNRSLRLNTKKSKIVFYKGLIPYKAREAESLKLLEEMKALDYRSRLQAKDYDIARPRGMHQDLGLYHSIQNDFPLVYGIGAEGLAPSSTDLRKAQAKQLKAFLQLIDQILANYCAQLSQVKNLFSINRSIKRSYFSQLLFSLPVSYKITSSALDIFSAEGFSSDDIKKLQPLVDQPGMSEQVFFEELQGLLGEPFLQQHKPLLEEVCMIPEIKVANLPNGASLVKEFVMLYEDHDIDWDRPSSYANEWALYLQDKKEEYWNNYCLHDEKLESSRTYEERRNRFLDHLLARFGEQFTDYVLLSTHMDDAKTSAELIQDKIDFLQNYPQLSRDRGKAFNYKQSGDPLNVSGLEMRASGLVGIKEWHRSRLFADYSNLFEVYQELDADGIDEWRFRLTDKDANILFSSTRHYLNQDDLKAAMQTTLLCGVQRQQYIIKKNKNDKFYFVLLDKDQNIIARRRKYYASRFDVELKIRDVIKILKLKEIRLEGFHLIEHVLLRPVSDRSDLFKLSAKSDCSPGFQDPYSFRVTAVVPYWPLRFQNMDFRRFFETTLRQEVPAHIHIKICWVNEEAMQEFENSFFRWLKLKSRTLYTQASLLSNNDELISEQNKLLHILENLNSIYPETHLFDCTLEGESNSILLNQAKLGSNKGD